MKNNRPKRPQKMNKGFGIFEILISVGLIALASMPIIQLLQTIFVNYHEVLRIEPSIFQSLYNNRQYTDGGTIFRITPQIGRIDHLVHDPDYQTFKHSMGSYAICPTKNRIESASLVPVLYTTYDLGMSSTTIATGLAINGKKLYISTDSSSTTEPDIYMYDSRTFEPEGMKDVGPGISAMDQFGAYVYYQNTGVKNQLGILSLRDMEVQKTFTIPGSDSITNPITKAFARYVGQLFIGTEKSVLSEIQIFDEYTGVQIGSVETGYGVNDLFISSSTLVVAGPRDPEIEVYDFSTSTSTPAKVATLDIPGGSGNGKIIQGVGGDLYIGRTKGGTELMKYSYDYGDTHEFIELDSYKIGWSIDEMMLCEPYLFVFTGDANKELQIFSTKDLSTDEDKFTPIRSVDLPGRVHGARFDFGTLYMTFREGAYVLGIIKF